MLLIYAIMQYLDAWNALGASIKYIRTEGQAGLKMADFVYNSTDRVCEMHTKGGGVSKKA